MTIRERARQALEKLEKDPKHRTPTDETDRQTRQDDITDPRFHKDGDVDPKWKKDAQGNWIHPDFE